MEQSQELSDKPLILVVDDTPDNLTVMRGLLRDDYAVKVAVDGEKALDLARGATPPDLILLDVMMPGMDAFEVCRQLKRNPATAQIPVIFLTAKTEEADEQAGFDVGAVDYLTKPVSPPLVLARVRTQLALKQARDFLARQASQLEAEVERRAHEVRLLLDTVMTAAGSLAETRDDETAAHLRRTQGYVLALANAVRYHPKYAGHLNDASVELIVRAAPLHDIGKGSIPDHILLKPGRLDPEEFEIMKSHTTRGRDTILAAEKRIGMSSDFLRCAREIAYCHHERWDGGGYPTGRAGETIPVSARLMALADVYDALISRRIYKAPATHAEAVEAILAGRGTRFDPALVDAFLLIEDEFGAVAAEFPDSTERPAEV